MNIDEDPLFVDSNSPDGDPNTWMEIDYHLQAESPCIDSGNNNEIPPDINDADDDGNTAEPFPFDLSGGLRILNGTVDMGAYEAFLTSTGESLGVGVSDGIMTSCLPVDPATLPDDGKPDAASLIYGLLDIVIETEIGGTTTVTISLPEPAPIGYTWFKYGYRFDEITMQYDPNRSWYDYSDHVVFSPDRTQVTISLVDGGIGDDDRMADGKAEDPSGLGAQVVQKKPGRGGDGDCFISTVTHGSTTKAGFGLILVLVSFTFIMAFRRRSE
jgi:hypothetical protein